ncbi:hypothetical protein BSY18_4120 (plasmid) [Blastomonas sp. RAC04]|nr:hypothetical protein BSY18_4120 [Blastomonas sp. RAC04]
MSGCFASRFFVFAFGQRTADHRCQRLFGARPHDRIARQQILPHPLRSAFENAQYQLVDVPRHGASLCAIICCPPTDSEQTPARLCAARAVGPVRGFRP